MTDNERKNGEAEEARWLDYSYHRECSKCGSITRWTDNDGVPIPNNYCPNCGADMRESDNKGA